MIRTFVLVSWCVLVLLLKLPSRYSFILGIVFFIFSAIAMVVGFEGVGLRLTTYSYGFFFFGTACYLYEIKNEQE